MHFNTRILIVTVSFIIFRVSGSSVKNGMDDSDSSLWKQQYEEELTDAMLSTKKGNLTRFVQSQPDNEAVIEKLIDTITASEKHMNKIENMDFRLNRLDVEIHEKTNDILARLTDLTKLIQGPEKIQKMDNSLSSLKSDLEKIRTFVDTKSAALYKSVNGNGAECHLDTVAGHRLISIENQMKSVTKSMDTISNIISEVKNRQHLKTATNTGGAFDALGLISEFRKMMHDQQARKCDCSRFSRADRSERYPTDCREIQLQGFNVSGIYKIKPDDIEPFYVLCDLTTSGGGWTVVQHRFDGSQDFYKGWTDYKNGFGNLAGEFWLGLEKLYYLTNQKLYELRIEMESLNGQEAAAMYSVFTIGPEHEGYRISSLGTYRGTGGDSLSYHAGQKFSTFDADNDDWKEGACSVEHGGAWWYKECDKSNLNGKFSINVDEQNGQNVYWITFKGPNYPLSKTRIMIRPLPATRPLDARALLAKEPSKTQSKSKPRTNEGNTRARLPYRYDDLHSEGFFPNYT